jgi:hypothetical protein
VIYLNAEQIEQSGIPYCSANKIQFQNKLFARGESSSSRLRQTAVEICNTYASKGLECLLLEVDGHLTIWHQMELPATSEPLSQSASEYPHSKPLRYRGAVINQTQQTLPQPAAGKLQYRGATIASSTQQSPAQPADTGEKTAIAATPTKRFYRDVAF